MLKELNEDMEKEKKNKKNKKNPPRCVNKMENIKEKTQETKKKF